MRKEIFCTMEKTDGYSEAEIGYWPKFMNDGDQWIF
jgi:hypothetical protein